MANVPHSKLLDDLVLHWCDQRDQGIALTPEEACKDYPHLLADFQACLEFMDRLGELADDLPTVDHPAPGDSTMMSPARVVRNADQDLSFLRPSAEAGCLGTLGPFRVLAKIGEGGMGWVLLAEDPVVKRQVALKVMKPSLAADGKAKARFLREARSAGNLDHDHIIPVYQVGEDNGVTFIAMPLLKGQSLESRLKNPTPIPLDLIVQVGRETALGLAAAHARGVLHRDIKPANLWLEARGQESGVRSQESGGSQELRVKVLDFGLALLVGEAAAWQQATVMTRTPGLGTLGYMSPEQINGDILDARSDLFNLGCVLYYLATRQGPFQRASVTATLRATAEDNPKPPAELNPQIPAALSQLIMRLLAKIPAERPASAQEVVETLQRIPTAQAISDTSLTPPRTPLDELNRKLLLAHSALELRKLLYELEAYLAKDPHSPDGRLLKDKIERALEVANLSRIKPGSTGEKTARSWQAADFPLGRRSQRSRLWTLAALAAVILVTVGTVPTVWLLNRDNDPPPPGPNGKGPPALKTDLDLRVWKKDDVGRMQALTDPGVLPLQAGDHVQIVVKSKGPVYFYLIQLESSGGIAPLYPWIKYDWGKRGAEVAQQELRWPTDPVKNAAPLTESPSGIEVIFVLTRDAPLSAQDQAALPTLFAGFPPPNKADLLRGAVWLADGEAPRLSREEDRGRIDLAQAKRLNDPIEHVRALLRDELPKLFTDSRAICYAFRGQ